MVSIFTKLSLQALVTHNYLGTVNTEALKDGSPLDMT